MQKHRETQKYINEQADRVAHIDGQFGVIIVSNTYALSSGV